MSISLPSLKLTQFHSLLPACPAERTVATESERRTHIGKLLHVCGVVRPGKYFVRRILLAVGLIQFNPRQENCEASGSSQTCCPYCGVSCGCRVLGVGCSPRSRLYRGKARCFLTLFLSPAAHSHTHWHPMPPAPSRAVLLGIGPELANDFGRRVTKTPESAQEGSG